MLDLSLIVIMGIGIGLFFGGLFAYADEKVYPRVAIAIMILGMVFMLSGLLAWDMTGHIHPPFAMQY